MVNVLDNKIGKPEVRCDRIFDRSRVFQRNSLQNSQVGVKEGLFLVRVSTNHFILAEALQNQREVITSNVTGTVKIGQ